MFKLLRRSRIIQSRPFSSTTETATTTKKDTYYKNLASQSIDESKPSDWDTALPFEKVPGPKPLPIIGNNFRFFMGGDFYQVSLHKFPDILYDKYGKIVNFRGLLNKKNLIFLFSPEDIEKTYRNEGAWPIREGNESFVYYKKKVRPEMFGCDGVMSSQGEEWFRIRSTVNPILMQPRTASQYVGVMDEVAHELVDKMKQLASKNDKGEMPANFINFLHTWALESIGVIALDKKFGGLRSDLKKDSDTQKFIENTLATFDLMYKLDVLPSMWRYVSTKDWRQFVKIMDNITSTSLKYIDESLLKIKNDKTKKDEHEMSVLQRLTKLDRNIAVAMVMDMLMAGVETTGKTMGATLYYLARYPEKQRILREEVLTLLPKKDTPVTKEILTNAPYLKAVLKETNRIAPIATGNMRRTQKDIVLGGYQIPKGTEIVLGSMFTANCPKYVKRPNEYLPERWLRTNSDELSAKNMHPFAYSPFGFGPRACIGKRFANLELEVGLLKIIRNFEMTWPHEDMKFGAKLLYGIQGPLKLNIKPLSE